MSPSMQLPHMPERKPATVPTEIIWRLSVEQYHQMIRAAILTDEDRVELLEGWLVQKMTKLPPHTVALGLAQDALTALAPAGWSVRIQDPVTLDDSEPEPDLALCRGERRDYRDRHPGPSDVTLVIEIADTSLGRDRGIKRRVYARNGIAGYWIVNLLENQVEVYTLPSGPTETPDYQQRQDYQGGQELPVVLDGCEVGRVTVEQLLP